MIETFQIVTLLQGLFLLIILYKNKEKYIFNNYFYLNATLISLLIYLLGDNNSKIFISDLDIFVVDNTLFITFLFLFVKNFNSLKPIKFLRILPYFIPVLIYFFLEIYEIFFGETETIEIIENVLYTIFVIYLILSFYYTLRLSVSTVLKLPFFILIFSLLINYGTYIFRFVSIEHIENLNSILVFEIAFVFYYLTYLFVFDSNVIRQPVEINKYKNSSLHSNDIEEYKKRIIDAMEKDRVFTNQNLSLQTFSEYVNIPKHYISEILNVYLNTNFQDFVNEYRVEEFIILYSNPENNHFSILGIAMSAGFKNKATFNSNFKKNKGVSPSEYKQRLKK